MHASGICYTDVHMTEGVLPASFPNTMGHEHVGEIEELGQNVTTRKIGDRIGVPWVQNMAGLEPWFPLPGTRESSIHMSNGRLDWDWNVGCSFICYSGTLFWLSLDHATASPTFFLLPALRLKNNKSGWAPFSRLVFGNLGGGVGSIRSGGKYFL